MLRNFKYIVLLLTFLSLNSNAIVTPIPNNSPLCNDSLGTTKNIIGNWTRSEPELYRNYNYGNDNKYWGYFINSEGTFDFSANWKIEDNKILYTYDYKKLRGSKEIFAEGHQDIDFILKLDCNSLIIKTISGKILELIKNGT